MQEGSGHGTTFDCRGLPMDHHQLIDLTRRALKLARDQTTDLAPAQHSVDARDYTSVERHNQDRALLLASPQLIGYVSELANPGSYCTKTVMGRSILLTRTADGSVKAFDNLPPPPVAGGDGVWHREAVHLPVPRMDVRQHRAVGRLPGREGFPEMTLRSDRLTELPAAEFAGFLWVR